MSTDWFLYSPSRKRYESIGSVGMSGVLPWPGTPEMVAFVRWAIDENVTDIVMLDEHRLAVLDPDDRALDAREAGLEIKPRPAPHKPGVEP